MRVSNSISVAEFRRRSPGGASVLAAEMEGAPSTNLEITPSTDEQKLNKTEKAWLEILRSRGYEWIGIQCWTFKLGDDCRYTPDLVTLGDGKLIAWECKGFMRDDALVKLKAAARGLRFIRFVVVRREKGQWSEIEIKP